jgi:hypothetical protein
LGVSQKGSKNARLFLALLPPLSLPVFSQRGRPPESRAVNPPPVNASYLQKKKNMLEARVQREGRARERFYYIKPAFSEVGVN